MARTVGTMIVKLGGDATGLEKSLRRTTDQLKKFEKKVGAVGKSMQRMGRGMTRMVTLPIVGALTFGVKAFADFDKAMTESLAIMQDVTPQLRREMEAVALQMSEESTFAARELAQAYFFLGSAGLSAAKSMEALPAVMRFAQAGAFDLSRATSLLAGSQAALGLESENATKNMENMVRISDVLVRANQLSDATTEQFGAALTRAAGVMSSYGVGLEEGVAVLAAYAKIQRKGEVGGEQFARVLRLLVPAARENAAAYEALGIRVFDADENLRNFADILTDMDAALSSMTVKQKSAALEMLGFQRRMQGAILPVLKMGDAVRGFQRELESAEGTTERVQKEQLKAFSNQMKIVWNRIVRLAITIGQQLVPTIEKIADKITEWTEKWKQMDQAEIENIVNWVKWIAAVGPALLIIGKLWSAGTKLIVIIGKLSMAVKVLAAAHKAEAAASTLASAALKPMASGIGLVTAKLGLLAIAGAAIWGIIDALKKMNEANDELVDSMNRLEAQELEIYERWGKSPAQIKALAIKMRKEQEEFNAQVRAQEAIAFGGAVRDIDPFIEELAKADKLIARLPYIQTQEDLDAMTAFQEKLNDAVIDQLSEEKKINEIFRQREELAKKIAEAQEGTKDFFELREKALELEQKMTENVQTQIDRFKEVRKAIAEGTLEALDVQKAVDLAKALKMRFPSEILGATAGAAVEAGSVQEYKLKIRAQKREKTEQYAKETAERLRELIEETNEQTTILREGLEAAGVQEVYDFV